MKRLSLVVVAAVLVASAMWWSRRPRPAADVAVVQLTQGDLRMMVNGSSAGEVMPEQRAVVRGEVPGTVAQVHHKRGERVKKGDVIISLDARDARARVAQADAALEAARVGVSSAETRVDGATKTRDRIAELVRRGGAAQAEADRVDIELAAAQEAVKAAQSQVKQAEAALQVARIALQRSDLRAPFPGVLQDVFVTVGMQVTPGAPIFDLIDDSHIYVQAPIDEVDAPRIEVGLPAIVSFDSMRGREVAGVVRAIAPAVARDERFSRTLRVEIDLKDPPPLRVGMAANVSIIDRVIEDVPVLPTLSVQGRGVERQVFVVANPGPDQVGKIEKRRIKVGAFNDEWTQVSGGIDAKDAVVHIANDPSLKDGMRAHAVPVAPPRKLDPVAASDGRPGQPAGTP